MADVIDLPERALLEPPTCFRCVNYAIEGWCRLFDEPIDSELFAARDCEAYEVADG